MDVQMLKNMILKRVDLKGLLVDDLLKGALHEALLQLVKKSDNTVDDALVTFLEPIIVQEVEKQINALLEKLKQA